MYHEALLGALVFFKTAQRTSLTSRTLLQPLLLSAFGCAVEPGTVSLVNPSSTFAVTGCGEEQEVNAAMTTYTCPAVTRLNNLVRPSPNSASKYMRKSQCLPSLSSSFLDYTGRHTQALCIESTANARCTSFAFDGSDRMLDSLSA